MSFFWDNAFGIYGDYNLRASLMPVIPERGMRGVREGRGELGKRERREGREREWRGE